MLNSSFYILDVRYLQRRGLRRWQASLAVALMHECALITGDRWSQLFIIDKHIMRPSYLGSIPSSGRVITQRYRERCRLGTGATAGV